MIEDLLEACHAFSHGDAPSAEAFIAEKVRWQIVNGEQLEGKAELLDFCAEMFAENGPDFEVTREILGEQHVVLEGTGSQPGSDTVSFFFCDIYTIDENQRIGEITCYVNVVNDGRL